MNAAQARESIRLVAYMMQLAAEERERVMERFEPPSPGSIVKHCNLGTIGVIKTQGDRLMLDLHSNAGLRPISTEELINWDVIQEPSE